MKFEKSVTKTFGLKKKNAPKISKNTEHNLAHIGYPELWKMSFFLTLMGLQLWKDKQEIHFSNTCCYCDIEKSMLLPYAEQKGGLFNHSTTIIVKNIPHCKTHGRDTHAKLIVSATQWTDTVIQVSLTGINLSFLNKTVQLNTGTDVVPPWMAFPQYNSVTSGWRQGESEFWWNHAWQPFWLQLSQPEKQRYLSEHQAPGEWVEFFGSIE